MNSPLDAAFNMLNHINSFIAFSFSFSAVSPAEEWKTFRPPQLLPERRREI